MASSALTPHLFLLFISTPPGRILPSLCGLIPNVIAPPPLPHSPLYFSTSAPTVRDDILNVQADGRLAAHLRETPAPHILEEDAEPNEDLTGNDFTYSHDTTTAFQELLAKIDSNTKELPNAALTQLPLTYPWARLVLDLKELLISFWPSPDHVPHCQSRARQRYSPPWYGPLKFSPPPRAAHFAYHSPPRYRRRTSFSSPPGNLPTWILARTPELCLHQIRHLPWFW